MLSFASDIEYRKIIFIVCTNHVQHVFVDFVDRLEKFHFTWEITAGHLAQVLIIAREKPTAFCTYSMDETNTFYSFLNSHHESHLKKALTF